MNRYIDFYNRYGISPVAQNMDNWRCHTSRRWGLYRQLGVLPVMIQGKKVAEIGPGGGYNALVTLQAEPSEYLLIEPSDEGFRQLIDIVGGVDGKGAGCSIACHKMLVEEYVKKNHDHYDIVICEGLIPGLNNKESLLDALNLMLAYGGLMIITCADTVSMLFENIRKALSLFLTEGIEDFDMKIEVLCSAFGSHFSTLRGASRSLKDWVIDLMLNPASYNSKDFFTIEDALNFFGTDYYYLGSSPQFLDNYTWYKELPLSPIDYNRPYIESYRSQRHHLIHYKEIFPLRNTEESNRISLLSDRFALQVDAMFDSGERDSECLLSLLQELEYLVPDGTATLKALGECVSIFRNGIFTTESIAEGYPEFKKAFGRGQQYLSLVRSYSDD